MAILVKYNIKDTDRDLVTEMMQKEKNAVVKERLLTVSLFLYGMKKRSISI